MPSDYRESVQTIVGRFKDGMLPLLGFYFAKAVNAGRRYMAKRAIDAALRRPLFSARPHRTNSRRDWQVFFVLEIGLAKGLSRSVIEQNASCDGWGAIDRHG